MPGNVRETNKGLLGSCKAAETGEDEFTLVALSSSSSILGLREQTEGDSGGRGLQNQ